MRGVEREPMLPPSLAKRLLNHARLNDVTQAYAADWTISGGHMTSESVIAFYWNR